ncbi:hypothetical protein [Streptomyces sp. S3(2020)]|uniref:hypothetical protein n=1 Tax=Streptomyces sp. S3(2020) TaxID=2732044 RepID=UPI0032167955
MVGTVVLAVAGVALLGMPHVRTTTAPPPSAAAYPTTGPSSPTPARAGHTPGIATLPSPAHAASPSPLESVSALPPQGEGAAGDRAIQRSLEEAWPADLAAGDERELLTAGRALLRADATGRGRAPWPAVFPQTRRNAASPVFVPAGFRIQAAIARRDGGPQEAVVHLVWAGIDHAGTFTELRITDWHFTRTTHKGAPTWIPQPRT